jgi:CRISPR-associated protein Cas4
VPSKLPDGGFIIAAGEIAEFTVCPRAWKLRKANPEPVKATESSAEGQQSHRSWAARADHLFVSASHAKLVVGLTLVVLFVWECSRRLTKAGVFHTSLVFEVLSVLALLLSLLCVLFLINRALLSERRSVGIGNESRVVAIDGSDVRERREYVSERLRLAGRPDAIVTEAGVSIPIEYKPTARKVRDRYVAQLLVYLRLLEETHGVRPPHGYLVIGEKAKRVKIENSVERQKWLQSELDVMRAVLAESMEAPTRPHPRKCARCASKDRCPDAAL